MLTFNELQSALFEILNFVNETVIGVEPGYLFPNALPIGRISTEVPWGNWGHLHSLTLKLELIQSIASCF